MHPGVARFNTSLYICSRFGRKANTKVNLVRPDEVLKMRNFLKKKHLKLYFLFGEFQKGCIFAIRF